MQGRPGGPLSRPPASDHLPASHAAANVDTGSSTASTTETIKINGTTNSTSAALLIGTASTVNTTTPLDFVFYLAMLLSIFALFAIFGVVNQARGLALCIATLTPGPAARLPFPRLCLQLDTR